MYYINYHWHILDEFILLCLSGLDGFQRAKWISSARKRHKIYWLYFFGIVLVAMIPFELFTYFSGILGYKFDVILMLSNIKIYLGGDESFIHNYELWEFSVCVWSLCYLGFFLLFEIPDNLKELGAESGAFYIGILSLIIVMSAGIYVSYLLLVSQLAKDRLLAEILIVSLLCLADLIFFFWFTRKGNSASANGFLHFLFIIDLPALISFYVLLAFLNRFHNNYDWYLPFVSGSAALSLILVNTIFSAIYIVEKYKSGKSDINVVGEEM